VQERAAPAFAGLGQVTWPKRVYRVREASLILATVDVGVGGGVDNHLRLMLIHGTLHGLGVCHVEPPPVEGHDLVVPLGKDTGQLQAELAAGTGQQDPHEGVPQGSK
jgi:hypothetical protein